MVGDFGLNTNENASEPIGAGVGATSAVCDGGLNPKSNVDAGTAVMVLLVVDVVILLGLPNEKVVFAPPELISRIIFIAWKCHGIFDGDFYLLLTWRSKYIFRFFLWNGVVFGCFTGHAVKDFGGVGCIAFGA